MKLKMEMPDVFRMRRRRESRWRSMGRMALPLAAGGVTGATVMYLADPDRGRRRRALARDRAGSIVRHSRRRVGRFGKRTGATLTGTAIRIWHLPRRPEPAANDQMLTDRILSQAFRDRDIPRGQININVEDGVAVLRGQLEHPDQIRALREAVAKVPGVREVESYLHLPEMPAPNKHAPQEMH
ncbi:MAG TPA: BON domain-containing protein [Thermomicrobiales bacterium]